MWGEEVVEELIINKDKERSLAMSNYMRNKFKFLGIQAVERRKITRPYFKEERKSKKIEWDFIFKCWDDEYREVQYIALDYLKDMSSYLEKEDIYNLKVLIKNKSWWDTIDIISGLVGGLVLENEGLVKMMLNWSRDENIWVRRVSILYQLKFKEELDTEILKIIIKNNMGTEEFFINKAIGWILREYSKIDQAWVRNYIEENEKNLNSLTIREGSKYI